MLATWGGGYQNPEEKPMEIMEHDGGLDGK